MDLKKLLFGLLLTIVSCSAPVSSEGTEPQPGELQVLDTVEKPDHKTAHWVISDEFTPEQLESFFVAADHWNISTKGRVSLTFEIATVTAPVPFTITKEKLDNKCCAAITSDTMDQIRVDADEYPDLPCVGRLWHIAAHEFGHTLGIREHGGDGVMREHKPDCNAHFTLSDIEMFNAANPE